MNQPSMHMTVPKNEVGRDFVIGDIHANKERFDDALASVTFDKENDRLFCVGDLIDRGEEPLEILAHLNEPWFFSIIGNHEQLIFDRFELPISGGIYGSFTKTRRDAVKLHKGNGGDWFCELTDAKQQEIYLSLKQLPFAITLVTELGDIGLVHAEVPEEFYSWLHFIDALQEDEQVRKNAIWRREAISEFYDMVRLERWKDSQVDYSWVEDVELTVHGHTGVHEAVCHGNQIWIDTGHVTKELTIIEVSKLFELVEK